MKANRVIAAAILATVAGFSTTAIAETLKYRCNDGKDVYEFEYSTDGKTVVLHADFGNINPGTVLKAVAGAKGIHFEDNGEGMNKIILKGDSKTQVTLTQGRRVGVCKSV
jgi:hypothetical protein